MDLTLRQLEYVVAVAEERHFRRAAERCHVTQPALSTQVRTLEEALGVQLFERDRRGVLITPEGEEVVARARRLLRDALELRHVARRTGRPLSGSLRLGVIPTVAPYLLPRLLPPLRRRHTELQLYLREERTDDLLDSLRAGRLEVLLLALPVDDNGLVHRPLFDEDFLLVAPRSHDLAGREALRSSELRGTELMLLEDGHCLRDQALEVCHSTGAREDGRVQASSLATLVQMVGSGLGLTLLPALAVARELEPEGPLVAIPFREPAPSRRLGLVWRESSARQWEFELLVRSLREIVREAELGRPLALEGGD